MWLLSNVVELHVESILLPVSHESSIRDISLKQAKQAVCGRPPQYASAPLLPLHVGTEAPRTAEPTAPADGNVAVG